MAEKILESAAYFLIGYGIGNAIACALRRRTAKKKRGE